MIDSDLLCYDAAMPKRSSDDPKTTPVNLRIPTDILHGVELVQAQFNYATRTDAVIRLITVGLQHVAEEADDQNAVESLMASIATLGAERDDLMAQVQKLNANNAQLGLIQRTPSGIAVDAAMRGRLVALAEMMSSGGVFSELGVSLSVDHVARLALNRGIAQLESPTSTPTAPPLSVRPVQHEPLPPPRPRLDDGVHPGGKSGQYASAMRMSQQAIDSRPTQYGQKKVSDRSAMAEASGDMSDKMEDIPQHGARAAMTDAGLLIPDPSWRPWSPDVDGDIAPEEAQTHAYYSMNGWYRWMRPLPDGRVLTFYWSDDVRMQGIALFSGKGDIIVDALPTGDRGIAHAIAVVTP